MKKLPVNEKLKRGPFYIALSFVGGLFVVAMGTIYRFVPQSQGVNFIKYQKSGETAEKKMTACQAAKKDLAYEACANVEKNQNIDYLFVGCNGFF